MQHRRNSKGFLGVAVFVAFLSSVTLGATVEITDPASASPLAHRPPEGIHGYGPGAVVRERIALEPVRARPASGPESVGTKISGTPMAGAVRAFALTPDGSIAVYAADQDTLGVVELYSTPVGGTPNPIKISDASSSGVVRFQIAAGGTHVVFLTATDVYSVPVSGSTPVRLNTSAQAPVSALGVAPVGTAVVFFGVDTTFASGATEVYRATIGTPSSGVQLSDAGASLPAGNVVAADFSADGATLIYAADAAAAGVFQWHSVSLSATGPMSDVQLSSAMGFVSLGAISPDSSTLVYTADENVVGVSELFSIPLSGGTKSKLNPSMAGMGVTSLQISGNNRVAYLADQLTAGVHEVFGAQIGVASSGTRLNTPLGGIQSADVVTIGPDDMTVLYEADENTAGTHDLLSVLIDDTAAPTTLDAMTPPNNAGFFDGVGTPVVGSRAIYPVVGTQTDLYSVPFAGGSSSVRINHDLAGDAVHGAFIPPSATRLTAYGVGASGGITAMLFAAPIRGDLDPEQVNTTAGAGSTGVLGYAIPTDEARVVFMQDQDTVGTVELYSNELDSDGDTVGNATDNCPFVDNMSQGDVVFGQTVRADGSTFVWDSAVDARYVRGPLESVATLVTNATGTLIDAISFTDNTTPAAGAGLYYLFAVDCSARSYQTALGAEGARDTAGFP